MKNMENPATYIGRKVKAVYDSLYNAKNDHALDPVKLEGETKRRVREDTAYNAPKSVGGDDDDDDGKPVSTYEKLLGLGVQGSAIVASAGLMKYGLMLEESGHPIAGATVTLLGALSTTVFALITTTYLNDTVFSGGAGGW